MLYMIPTLAEPILSTIPAFIDPAAPALRSAPPIGPSWRHEVKFDGWRAQVHENGAEARMLSRKGRDISYLARAVIRDVAVLPVRECILDGKLIAVGPDGRPSFEAMGSRRNPHCLCAFDLLWIDGEDLRPLPLAERQRRLAGLEPLPRGALAVSPRY